VLQDKAPESWQHDITAWGNGCFPELPVIPRALSKDGKEFLAVVVPLSDARPHFARPEFRRQGAATIRASQQEIDEWIAYRSSKVRLVLDWKGKIVRFSVQNPGSGGVMFGPVPGEYKVVDCNEHFVTLYKTDTNAIMTQPLAWITLKMDDANNRL